MLHFPVYGESPYVNKPVAPHLLSVLMDNALYKLEVIDRWKVFADILLGAKIYE